MEPHDNVAYYDRLAGLYELFFHDMERSMEAEGNWLDLVLRRYEARAVLDASCGTGRQAVPLLMRGYRVHGVDPSAPMLREAARNAQRHGVSLPLVKASFADLPRLFSADFDAVIALGNSLCNVADRDDMAAALAACRACCRSNALCLIGIKDFDCIRAGHQRFHGHRIVDQGPTRTILFEIWDVADPILVSTAFVLESVGGADDRTSTTWNTWTVQTREHMVGLQELTELARKAGFDTVERLEHPAEAMYLLR